MSRFLSRVALVLLGVAWLLHAFGTVWRTEAAAEIAEVVAQRSDTELGEQVAARLTEAGVTGIDTDELGAELAKSAAVAGNVSDAASEVWDAELKGQVAKLGDALNWTVDVARTDDTTTVTLDPAAVSDALAEIDPAYAEAWNANPQTQQSVTVDVSSAANIAGLGALPAAVAQWAWPLAALGLILAAISVLVASGRRAAAIAIYAWVLIGTGVATYIAVRALRWAAQRDDVAGTAAEIAAVAGSPLATQSVLITIAGVAILAAAAFVRLISPAR